MSRYTRAPPALPSSCDDSTSDDDDETDRMSVTSSTWTDQLPCLTRGNSIASSDSPALTEAASGLHGGPMLETSSTDGGVLTLPETFEPDADLLCPFQILDCDKTFSDIRQYKVHVFSHFRGRPLPDFASCFLCDNKYSQAPTDDVALAWNTMLSHMIHDHFRRGQRLATIRTDFALMRWMYDRHIISDHHFKRTQMCPAPTILPGSPNNEADGRTPEVVNMPRAPTPPPLRPPTHSDSAIPTITERVAMTRGINQPWVRVASRRDERRRLEQTRPMRTFTQWQAAT